MKKIKILTLLVLLMGFFTVTAQQTTPAAQKSDVVPATEQLNETELDASQPPALIPDAISPSSIAEPSTAKDLSNSSPAEPNASMPPAESQKSSGGQDEATQSVKHEQSGDQGRSAADPPAENEPMK